MLVHDDAISEKEEEQSEEIGNDGHFCGSGGKRRVWGEGRYFCIIQPGKSQFFSKNLLGGFFQSVLPIMLLKNMFSILHGIPVP